ncbi:lamin tail domain-containing protein [Pollutibacter soli]|uniref:lamin tail domain-containing protein n=1 Tax=Pollutibacter soli TaxID=3034157 RepID=UPI003013AD5D
MKAWIPVMFCLIGWSSADAQPVKIYDIVITELLADPNPSVGLPEAEFIEIKNNSNDTIILLGWIISDGNSRGRITENIGLPPDSFLIICSNAYKTAFEKFGTTAGISGFPSLDNRKDQLMLFAADGRLIHGIEYNIDSFPDPVKVNGGWSLEMMDESKPCSGWKNWRFSVSPVGGTPGKKNAITSSFIDEVPLSIISSFATDSLHIVVVFNKSVDSAMITLENDVFTIDNGIGQPQQITVQPPLFNTAVLLLSEPLMPDHVFTLSASSIPDCYGSRNNLTLEIKTGFAGKSYEGLIINEILFNPRPSGIDFVEIYNAGNSIIDLNNLLAAGRNNTGEITGMVSLSNQHQLIFPGDYYLVSEDFMIVSKEYEIRKNVAFLNVDNLPSWPDDKGSVILLNNSGDVIDEFSYSEKMHYPLVNDPEGVSLERIDPFAKTQDASNWMSAASDAGYATPGRKNSQFKRHIPSEDEFSTDLKIFSPDNDGHDDQLTISYKLDKPGYNCSISIFNQAGFLVNNLVKNQVCGTEGYFRWNGLNDRNQLLLSGIYYLVIDLFHLDGKRKIIRKAAVLVYRN